MPKAGMTKAMQAALEDHLLQWPGVTRRKIFGYDGYYGDGRLFAFIGERGIVLKPPEAEREALLARDGASGWSPDPGKELTKAKWIEAPCADEETLEALLPFLAHALSAARTAPQTGWRAERRRRRNAAKGPRLEG